MITSISITGRVELGEFPLHVVGCNRQPVAAYIAPTPVPIANIVENSAILGFQECDPYPAPLPPVSTNQILFDFTEWTSIYAYVLVDAYNFSGTNPQFDRYYAAPDRYVYATSSNPNITAPRLIRVNLGVDSIIYEYIEIARFPSRAKYYQFQTVSSGLGSIDKPNYMALVNGYSLDNRLFPEDYPVIIPTKTETVKIRYYHRNDLESIPELKSIDWLIYDCNLVEGVPYKLPLKDCVLGTLKCDSSDLITALLSVTNSIGRYPYSSLLETDIPVLFAAWTALYAAYISTPVTPPSVTFSVITNTSTTTRQELAPILHVLGANNNAWNNRDVPTDDLNFDISHPMFAVDNPRAFTWHVATQIDGSFGTLVMDSPRLIEIHAALDAAKFAYNTLEPADPRVTNLGHLIAKTAELLGYHPNDNGEYIVADEKQKIRRLVKDDETVDQAEYGGNYFASEGMLVKRVPNAFNARGEIVSGGVAMVHTLPEYLAEMQDQLRIALNLQESGAIEIKDGDRTYRYAGQLQLLTDLVLGVAAIHQLVHQGYISSLVTQQQTGEIIAGMGLPTVNRVTNIAIDNKLEQIPYWGIAPQHSLARKIDTVGYNVGIVTGQLI
jgi:hypothetical protein